MLIHPFVAGTCPAGSDISDGVVTVVGAVMLDSAF
jgi:hypothetical protein